MKKKIVVFLAIILVFWLTACGNNANDVPIRNTNISSQSTADSYIGNKISKKFHIPSCHTLPKEENRVYFSTIDEAIRNDYTHCENCQP